MDDAFIRNLIFKGMAFVALTLTSLAAMVASALMVGLFPLSELVFFSVLLSIIGAFIIIGRHIAVWPSRSLLR